MRSTLIVVMGPSGCGKSTIGARIAEALGAPFLEGDDFHTSANIAKMSSGNPLSDTDRATWLDAIDERIGAEKSPLIVLACSALTDYVQMRLRSMPVRQVRFIHLEASQNILAKRMKGREGHFMPLSLLDSQLKALRTPHDALILDAGEDASDLVTQALSALGESREKQRNREPHEAH